MFMTLRSTVSQKKVSDMVEYAINDAGSSDPRVTDDPGTSSGQWHTLEGYVESTGAANVKVNGAVHHSIADMNVIRDSFPLADANWPIGPGPYQFFISLSSHPITTAPIIWIGRIKLGTSPGASDILDYDPSTVSDLSYWTMVPSARVALAAAPITPPNGDTVGNNSIRMHCTASAQSTTISRDDISVPLS